MSSTITLILLGLYIWAMGITGWLRTGATMPLILNGAIGGITLTLGWLITENNNIVRMIAMVWLIAQVLTYGYMTIFGVRAHPNPTIGTYLIFGSMAVLALGAFIILLRNR